MEFSSVRNRIILIVSLSGALFSCSNEANKTNGIQHKVIVDGNKTTVHSFELDSLKELMNLAILPPEKAEYNYVLYDNSAKNERMGIPGPSDHYLQAVLHYDDEGMNEVIKAWGSMSIRRPQYPKSRFDFEWLNKDDKRSLDSLGDSIKGCPNLFYGTAAFHDGGFLIADKKVFVFISNN